VNFAHTAAGTFAYVTIGGLNQVKVFRTDDFTQVATIPVGALPHGLWPSGDGTRIYVGLENADSLAAIDTASNQVVANVPVGQATQAIVYVPNAVPEGAGTQGLQPIGIAAQTTQLTLVPVAAGKPAAGAAAPTSVTLFDQGLLQVLQASATGLQPRQPYVLALASRPDGTGALEPLATFNANPAGAAIVNAIGPIRQVVQGIAGAQARRYLVIAPAVDGKPAAPVQVQAM
jgi:YVTN family beta-propeller protein